MNLDKFRKNLQKVRRSKALTAKELSKLCESKQLKRIADIEDGRGKPTLDEVYIICEILKVSMDCMINKNVEVNFTFD